jgi:uncharacterized membrane protein
VIAANFLGARLIRGWESCSAASPSCKSIYSSVKQVSDTLAVDKGNAFRKALLGRVPAAGQLDDRLHDRHARRLLSRLICP